MRQSEEIEYVLVDGKPSINPDHFTNDIDIELLEVEFEGSPHWEDDRFDYEYGGMCGTAGDVYLTMDGDKIIWDKNEYSDIENIAIEAYLEKYRTGIEERLCVKAENYCDI